MELGDKIATVNGPQAPDPPPYSFHLHSRLRRRHNSASRVTGGDAEHREAEQLARGHTAGVQGAGSALHHCTSIAGSLVIASDSSRKAEPIHTSLSTTCHQCMWPLHPVGCLPLWSPGSALPVSLWSSLRHREQVPLLSLVTLPKAEEPVCDLHFISSYSSRTLRLHGPGDVCLCVNA